MIEDMSREAARDAIELLQIFSFLLHDRISEEMFHRAWKTSGSDPPSDWIFSHQLDRLLRQSNPSQEWDFYPLRAVLSILLSFSLIPGSKDHSISIHPLVHTWTRDRLRLSSKETIWHSSLNTYTGSAGKPFWGKVALFLSSILE